MWGVLDLRMMVVIQHGVLLLMSDLDHLVHVYISIIQSHWKVRSVVRRFNCLEVRVQRALLYKGSNLSCALAHTHT